MIKDINIVQNIINIDDKYKEKYKTHHVAKHLIGFVIYIVLFVIIVPIILFKLKSYTVLEAYLPNVDLLATVLTWTGGPYNMWEYLYHPTPTTIPVYASQIIINYIALLGLTYIISRETKRTNSILKGWTLAFIMLITTYLLPCQIISWIMESLSKYLFTKRNIVNDIFIASIGFLTAISIILFEVFIIKSYRNKIEYFVQRLINIPKLLKK